MSSQWIILACVIIVSCSAEWEHRLKPRSEGSNVPPAEAQDNFYFSIKPSNTDVVEGREAKLQCNVNNRKHIAFHWTMNDVLLVNDSRRFQEDSHLRILRVSRQEDSGRFACIATNTSTGFPIKSPAVTLNIQWLSKEAVVRRLRASSPVVKDANINLKCVASGNPEPSVRWYRNKITIFPGPKSRLSNEKLRLLLVSASDNGVYSCLASNEAGEVDSWTNFVLNIRAPNAAYLIQDTFKDINVLKRNTQAVLNCKFENVVITDWYFGDEKLSNTSRITLYPNGSLALDSVKPRDAGTYKCIGISSNGPAQQFTSELIVASLADLTLGSFDPSLETSRQIIMAAGKRFEITCYSPGGVPEPRQRWIGPTGSRITDGGRIFVEENKLVISSLQPDDTGIYTCAVSNLAGEKRGNVSLIVSIPPSIRSEPSDLMVKEDDVAVFQCTYSGSPAPVTRVYWMKGVSLIYSDQRKKIMDFSLGSKLTINKVRTSDKGMYSCKFDTVGHSPVTTDPAELKVRRKLKFKPRPVDKNLELNSVADIHCIAEGETQPTVRWLSAQQLALPPHVKDEDGRLIFDGVKKSDAGQYTCVAVSDSVIINATIQVNVVVKPQIKMKPANTNAIEGEKVMMNCVAIGDPTPQVNWDKNKNVMQLDQRRMKILPNGTLVFLKVQRSDAGMYGCIAGNMGGLTRSEARLRVLNSGGVPIDTDQEDLLGELPQLNGTIVIRGPKGESEDGIGLMKTVVIAVCSAVAYLALVVGLTICCSIRIARKKKRKSSEEEGTKGPNGEKPKEMQGLMSGVNGDAKQNNHKTEDVRSNASSIPSHSSQSHGSRKRESYNSLKFPRHDLQTVAKLGKGMFGDVFLAKARGIRDDEPETLVVVKSLLSKDDSHHFDFRHEMDMFSKLNHENVVKLMGVCRETEPIYIILEYLDWGDLKQFLMATRKDNGRHVKVPPLTLAQKVTLCNQIALGMEHLSNNRFVHKDLAARNIMLSSSLNVKITSLGLSKDVYASEYYTHHNIAIPLRWMPAESIFEDDYSTKSDVWAFGIFFWEVLTGGDLPYRSRSNEEVLEGLKTGDLRPELLPYWPEELQSLLIRCWSESPKVRPSFSQITLDIGQLHVDSDV